MNNYELFSLKTEEFYLSILGPKPSENSFALKNFSGATFLSREREVVLDISYVTQEEIFPLIKVLNRTRAAHDNLEVNINTQFERNNSVLYLPLFYENIDYQVQLTNINKSNKKFTLWHENPTINKNLSYFENHQSFSGTFNFRNNVGLSNFLIKENDKILYDLNFTVFSLKIDYLTDRYYMIEDLKGIQNNILYKLFNPTKMLSESTNSKASGLEWLVNFYNYSEKLIKILRKIEIKSHSQLSSTRTIQRVDKIKKPNKELVQKINKYGKNEIINKRTIEAVSRISNNNTKENQYIKYLMRTVIRAMDKWVKYIRNNSESLRMLSIIESSYFIRIEASLKILNKSMNNPFWSKIEENNSNIINKTNFLFHHEFRQFEKTVNSIKKAVELHKNGSTFVYTLSMEDLYEFWTFCKLAEVISMLKYNNDQTFQLKTNTDAFSTKLSTGLKSEIKIDNDTTISTNRWFKTNLTGTYYSPHTSQKPDLVFEIKSKKQLHIFDAKYKIKVVLIDGKDFKELNNRDLIMKDLSTYSPEKILYLPKDEDINTIHRYRDAILTNIQNDTSNGVSQRAVKKGIILYPSKPSKSEEHLILNFLNKLDKFEIGALPLAPGSKDTNWLADHVRSLIPDNHLEKEQIRILANQVSIMLDESL